jgi:hypothetical protein
MIKEITIYETTDRSRFESHREAVEYEKLYERCNEIMQVLRDREDDCAVRQDIKDVKNAFEKLMSLCAEKIPDFKSTFNKVSRGEAHQSWAARILSDYSSEYRCLYHSFFRFECINMVSGIEYEQPYYAAHESEWKGEIL